MHALWPVLLGVTFVLFFAPGLAVGVWLRLRYDLPAIYVVPVAALASCLFGYLTFWVFLASPAAGRALSIIEVLLAGGALAGLAVRARWRAAVLAVDVVVPLALLAAVALLYYGIYTSCEGGVDPCLTTGYPVDNLIPALFAHQVAIGEPRTLLGDWHYSDRPPLQTGAVLALDLLISSGGSAVHEVRYELLGTLLQCLWIPAMWAIYRRLGLPGRSLAPALGICVVMGFFFFNSVYVWPKLLAAACAAVAILLLRTERPGTLTVGLSAMFTAAALLAHTGVVFGLVPFGALLLVRRYRPSLRDLAVGVGAAAALLAPWTWYQRFYDPPGDRLLKWHLAGVIPIDDRSFLQALVDSYTTTPLSTLVSNRVENLRILVLPYGTDLRANEFFHVFIGIGILNLGFVLLALPAIQRRLHRSGIDRRLLVVLLGGAVAGLLVWCLALFSPGTAFIHQGSYVTMLLLIAGAATAISVLPTWTAWLVVGAQTVSFTIVWIIGPLAGNRIDILSLGMALVGLAAVVAWLGYVHRIVAPATIVTVGATMAPGPAIPPSAKPAEATPTRPREPAG